MSRNSVSRSECANYIGNDLGNCQFCEDAGIWRNCYIDIVDHTLLDEVEILQENDLDKKSGGILNKIFK